MQHADPACLEGWKPAPFALEGGFTEVVQMGEGPVLVLLPQRLALSVARRLAARERWVYDPSCDDRVLEFVRFCIRDVGRDAVRSSL